ncbi:TetR/AcrR family transcriptional regulator [Gordonia hydrophobica]|uniref:Helix-turn-helix domain-containing protein n=1 Tax=Gordonia hydrophobica TaxID=40516 RepID=A0ABZ2U4B5_9ACTN|nr:TetR/AcrR family transcriptional regulator [Gordonia hydrophobica]MBM7368089.1 AcrR family transcriptional regulator [Gordonia hydrophobica]
MARRRLSVDERRAEIIAVATEAIATDGYSSLSLREMARRAGMSTPGLIRYFPTMEDLLVAVLETRDAHEAPRIAVDTSSLLAAIDSILDHYRPQAERSLAFDLLEGEALNPSHPAHDYFARRNARTVGELWPLIEREFLNPEGVAALITLLLGGARLRVLHDPSTAFVDGWPTIRAVIDTLPRRPDFSSRPSH